MRVPYGQEMKLKILFNSLELECFIPMQYKTTEIKGKRVTQLAPAIRNLIFVNSEYSFLNQLKRRAEGVVPFRYIIDKAINAPVIVPEREMNYFVAIAGTLDEQLIYLTKIEPILKTGDKVQITGGMFKGIEGQVVRIKKDRRVMVSIDNVVAVVTSFINPLLLKKIEVKK